jgi:hypothetical protein
MVVVRVHRRAAPLGQDCDDSSLSVAGACEHNASVDVPRSTVDAIVTNHLRPKVPGSDSGSLWAVADLRHLEDSTAFAIDRVGAFTLASHAAFWHPQHRSAVRWRTPDLAMGALPSQRLDGLSALDKGTNDPLQQLAEPVGYSAVIFASMMT